MRFVETHVFTALLRRHLDDERYRQLQLGLMLRPEQGPVIKRSGGLRKVRWAPAGIGKRGGVRVIYAKNEQGDLTARQNHELAKVVREEFT